MQSDHQYHSVACLFVAQARIGMISRSSCWEIKTNELMLIYSRFQFTKRVFTHTQEHTHTSTDTQRTAAYSMWGCQSEANNDQSALRIWFDEIAEQIVHGLAIIGSSSAYLLLSAISADGCWEPGLTMRWSHISEEHRSRVLFYLSHLFPIAPVIHSSYHQDPCSGTEDLYTVYTL